MKYFILIITVILTFTAQKVSSQHLNLDSNYSLCCVKSFASKMKVNKKKKSNKITFVFFQDFSDSVFILINKAIVFSDFVLHDSNKVSSKYTGFSYTSSKIRISDKISIIYKEDKRFININRINASMIMGIYNYKNKNCYVSKMDKSTGLK